MRSDQRRTSRVVVGSSSARTMYCSPAHSSSAVRTTPSNRSSAARYPPNNRLLAGPGGQRIGQAGAKCRQSLLADPLHGGKPHVGVGIAQQLWQGRTALGIARFSQDQQTGQPLHGARSSRSRLGTHRSQTGQALAGRLSDERVGIGNRMPQQLRLRGIARPAHRLGPNFGRHFRREQRRRNQSWWQPTNRRGAHFAGRVGHRGPFRRGKALHVGQSGDCQGACPRRSILGSELFQQRPASS